MAKDGKGKEVTYIQLFDGYAIAVDSYNYAVAKRIKDKNGEPSYKTLSFHSTLDNALIALKDVYARRAIRSHDALVLDDAISTIVRSNNRFEALIKNAFKGVTV